MDGAADGTSATLDMMAGPGHPSDMIKISCYMPRSLIADLKAVAVAYGRPYSVDIRRACETYVGQELGARKAARTWHEEFGQERVPQQLELPLGDGDGTE